MQTEEGNGSNKYRIRKLNKFETSHQALIKKHYRKDTKGKKEFVALIEDYERQIEVDPCSNCVSDPEPFPSNTAGQDLEFRKKRWPRLPRLQGAARFGRLLFIVCRSKRIVYLIWVYTHAEFQEPKSRPPDKELKAEINFVKQELLNDAENACS